MPTSTGNSEITPIQPAGIYCLFFLHGEIRSQHIFILFKERQIKINPQHATYENGIISKQKKFQHVK